MVNHRKVPGPIFVTPKQMAVPKPLELLFSRGHDRARERRDHRYEDADRDRRDNRDDRRERGGRDRRDDEYRRDERPRSRDSDKDRPDFERQRVC